MVAFLVGQRDVDAAEHIAGQSVLVALALGALAAFTVGLFPRPFVALVVHPEAVEAASVYARIAFFTFVFNVCAQLFNGVLGGSGDATTPMMISLVQVPIAITAEWALCFGHLGMPALGIAGIPLGMAVGGFVSVALSGWALMSGRCRVHLRARHFRPDPAALRRIVGAAWQPTLQMVARSLMVFVFMWLAGRLGSEVQAAYTIGLRIEMIAVMVAFPIANACATVVGQNLGANDTDRAWRAIFVACGIEIALLWPLAAWTYWQRDWAVSLFTEDPQVAAIASEYLMYVSFILLFWGIYFVAFRALQAAGDMISPMLISIVLALGLGTPLALYLSASTNLGATGMWIANATYATANAVLMVAWLATGRWTRRAPGSAAPGG